MTPPFKEGVYLAYRKKDLSDPFPYWLGVRTGGNRFTADLKEAALFRMATYQEVAAAREMNLEQIDVEVKVELTVRVREPQVCSLS